MKGFFQSSAVQKEGVSSLIPRCGQCGIYKTCQSPKMKPHGEGRRDILVVGEAPGATEDERGRPFVGKAGQHLRGILDGLGFDLDRDATTTNALICRPPGNKTPDSKQIGYCRPNLVKTIGETGPNVIVTLGRSALVSVLERFWKGDVGPMEKWVGWKIPLEEHWICPTYHPSYLLRMKNPLLDRLFSNHLQAAFEIDEDQDPPERENLEQQVELLYDEEKIVKAIRRFDREGDWLVVDYETNCVKPEWPDARIVSCALSNGDRTISYPWFGKAIEETGILLRSCHTNKIASNLKFEERWTRKFFGHGVSTWKWDTMLAAHCLDNRTGITSLKFQAFVRLGIESYNENVDPYLSSFNGPYNRIKEIELPTLLMYGGMDAILEYRLAMKQRKDMGL